MRVALMPSEHGGGQQEPTRIVIHAMGEYIDTDDRDYHAFDWLEHLGLSCHALAAPSGVLIRCRWDNRIAWHAKGFNTGSLGIEFLVPGLHTYESFLETINTVDWVTEEALLAGVGQVQEWLGSHRIINLDQHSTLSPGRKHDPGPKFPWDDFLEKVGWPV